MRRKYDGTKDIILTLDENMKFSDYDYLSLYCADYNHNFGDIAIPDNLNLPPYVEDLTVSTN